MPFPTEERKALMDTPMIGKTIISRLESIDIHSMGELATMEAPFICELIAGKSGLKGWATHSMATASIENAIEAARRYVRTHQ